MDLFLLLVVTAVYFIRPAEWVPGLIGSPLFLIAIIPCSIASVGKWLALLNGAHFKAYPISACVLGLQALVLISELFNQGSIEQTIEFGKACAFYILIIAIVDSRHKLEIFAKGFACILVVMGGLVLLAHHGSLPSSLVPVDSLSEADPAAESDVRLGALGAANFDANDTAALLVLGLLCCLHFILTEQRVTLKVGWLAMAATSLSVLGLTNSRGGFLALMCGIGTYAGFRWGKKGFILALCFLPILAVQLATDRMLGFQDALVNDTGQKRIQLWNEALMLFEKHPVFGVGPVMLVNHMGKAAHNSFVQAFSELGFLGGTMFLSAFLYGGYACYRMARSSRSISSEQHSLINHTLLVLTLLVSYAIAITALNHVYAPHTLLILALATVCSNVYHFHNTGSFGSLLIRCVGCGACFLVFMSIVSRSLVRW